MLKSIFLTLIVLLFSFQTLQSQSSKKSKSIHPLDSVKINDLKWRHIGPSLTSGRISDVAVNPNNPFEYYVASASGGVWKTTNSGVVYTPIFDKEGSYSIGCITLDPNNSNVVWVGTGENNNQRSVAYGDGIYKSVDGGVSWKNMGLKNSEHIGKIIVHPENSNIVYVASIGPLWNKGGDRGLYMTSDGGVNWVSLIEVDEHTGVNDVVMDPRNPEVLYASTYQRRRHVYTYVGSGPGSGLHKSTDGGKTWREIKKGLPSTELGRIGLAISPANPEIIYAIVEAANGKSGFFASTNRGESWEKRSDHVTSGNYYQEIVADPIDENTIFSMDTWLTASYDGGKTFNKVGEVTKHVDNHSIWINPKNNKHWLVGCDGGIYETFDAAKTWDFKENLPVTQFYKVAVDNDYPFYNVYGGTQDNFSLGGPSRVLTNHGITNSDWFITNGGDGFESQVDPNNPDIVYAQSQYGFLVRYDKKSGESVGIQPREREGEDTYKFNWDAPLVASKHASGRLYFSANKVFKSNDYGNSWEVISDDLSRKIDRNKLKVYDRIVSIDAVAKNASTSLYGTIVAFSESSINENLLAAGTDDGLIHISSNGGDSWRKIESIPGVPSLSYVNSIHLSKHDENVIYVAFNHHKFGDFKPYIYKSNDKGNTWKSISNNLPNRGSVYSIEEDHIDKNLIFCGTEFGVFFSPDSGSRWKKISNGLPTIAVRDIAIQERENDLVLGTFGRGFYVLDDYSVLRAIENSNNTFEPTIFSIRDGLIWEQSSPLGLSGKAFQGDNFFTAPNLGPEVIITYYYNNSYQSLKDARLKEEKILIKQNKDANYPTYNELTKETTEDSQELVFIFKDNQDNVVNKTYIKPKEGVNRFNWNLRYTLQDPIKFSKSNFYNPFASKDEGTLVLPGTYSVQMYLLLNGEAKAKGASVSFKVKALDNTTLPVKDRAEKVQFQKELASLSSKSKICMNLIKEMDNKLKYIKEAVKKSEQPLNTYGKDILNIEKTLKIIKIELLGDNVKRKLDIDQPQNPMTRLRIINGEQKYSTSAPTQTHRESYSIAKKQIDAAKQKLETLYNVTLKSLEDRLVKSGMPYTPGRGYEH
ncbi:glycosyl hydrolase [uncultured Algibacter sp.]|uniref:VPS10 domain-containing protein n=1 Tax=uncultured Algibacter sp. TaxID=298659 RepID=UPI00262FF0CF|nr:glycosyl hydrolase [uncultured Algibacter sp.]